MNQADARKRAVQLNGIAVGARCISGRWILGGWASQPDETWIVIDVSRKSVLDDGSSGRKEDTHADPI